MTSMGVGRTEDDLRRFGARRIEYGHENGVRTGRFTVFYDGDVVGTYSQLRRDTIELGPLRLRFIDGEAVVSVAGDGYLVPKEVMDRLTSMTLSGLIEAGYNSPDSKLDGGIIIVRAETRRGDDLPGVSKPLVHPMQWVQHPNWGRGIVQSFVLGSTRDVAVLFDDAGVQVVDHDNLTPLPHLGPRWSVEFEKLAGMHRKVVVRAGTPGSRALLGQLVMTENEATEFRLVMEKAGAIVE